MRPLVVARDTVPATTGLIARGRQVPRTSRGAGTSIAGNSIGTGIVLDLSRHL